jgi:hypothetical protein
MFGGLRPRLGWDPQRGKSLRLRHRQLGILHQPLWRLIQRNGFGLLQFTCGDDVGQGYSNRGRILHALHSGKNGGAKVNSTDLGFRFKHLRRLV